MPCSIARRPAASAAICAAYGVDLREALETNGAGRCPRDDRPLGSVIEMTVLLKVLLMCAWPATTFFFSLRRTFGGAAAACGCHISCLLLAGDGFARRPCGSERWCQCAVRAGHCGDDVLVGTDLDLAPDVRGDLPTKITFDLVVRLDPVPERDQVVVGQLVDSKVATDLRSFQGCKRGSYRSRKCR